MARYYDHAKNTSNPAIAHAIAASAREAKAEENWWTVEFFTSDGELHFWNGAYYDALGLAKQLHSNKRSVTLISPTNDIYQGKMIRTLRY